MAFLSDPTSRTTGHAEMKLAIEERTRREDHCRRAQLAAISQAQPSNHPDTLKQQGMSFAFDDL